MTNDAARISLASSTVATNTIVQWPWLETHAPITCVLFANVIRSRARARWERTTERSNRAVEDQRNGIAIKPILEIAVACPGYTSPDAIGLDSPAEDCVRRRDGRVIEPRETETAK